MPPAPAEIAAGPSACPTTACCTSAARGRCITARTAACRSSCRRELHEEAAKVPKTMARSPGHYEEWLAACKGGPRPVSNFDYAGPLTEIVLLGVLSLCGTGPAAGVGQREPEGQERPGAQPVHPHRVPQGVDVIGRPGPLPEMARFPGAELSSQSLGSLRSASLSIASLIALLAA